jgi:DNA helicase-2/ATP-dependent DNA helicase PcrA
MNNSLNEQQQKVVDATEGPVMVIAGAGSGKTRTITYRIRELIIRGVSPSEILAITFTNKSAKEMRERTVALIKNSPEINRPISEFENPFVSTFHSLGVHILRQQHEHLNIPKSFNILDRGESKAKMKKAIIVANLDPKQFEPARMLGHVSKQKGEGLTLKQFESKSTSKHFLDETIAKVWKEYESILKKDKVFDFDDLLLQTKELLKNNEDIRKYYQNVWKYIHVDEYQDTNNVQHQIIELLSGENRNLCVVGDIDQNIYSWRGAKVGHMMDFEKKYPNCKVILLEQNYRSTKVILDAANQIIEKNINRKDKVSFTDNDSGEKITIHQAYNEKDEARYIANEAKDLIKKGVDPSDIAILYRANFQSRIIEEMMLNSSVPYQVLGTKFFDRKEVKDILAYIKVALNRSDSISMERAIGSPKRGIGKVTVLKILEGKMSELKGKTLSNVELFFTFLDRIEEFANTKTPKETLEMISKESGILDGLHKLADGEDRIANIFELISLCDKYKKMEPIEGIEKLLEEAALASDQDDLNSDNGGVKLMTVHAAKGLEFDYVFITGMEEGLFPHEKRGDEKVDEEEERRLFYVALTRAGKKLYLTHAGMRTIFGNTNIGEPSSFLEDIDESLIDYVHKEEDEDASKASLIFIDF